MIQAALKPTKLSFSGFDRIIQLINGDCLTATYLSSFAAGKKYNLIIGTETWKIGTYSEGLSIH